MNRTSRWMVVAAALQLLAAGVGAQTRPAVPELPGNLPAQKIRPDDLLALSVYDSPELTRTVRVSSEGTIRLPMVKQRIRAQGLMPSELETAISEALQSEQILVDPIVTVTVAEYGGRPVSVGGAVKNPITFQAAGRVTLLDALARAGGLSPEAGPDILLTTSEEGPNGNTAMLTRRIAVKALIDAADPDVNVILSGGEEIRVPEAGKIYVVGNVKKPGAFPTQENSETTILKALALAEGLAPYAGKEAYIIRRDDKTGAKNELPIELKKILDRKAADVPLLANDILYIPDNSSRRASMTAIEKIAGFAAATVSGVLIYSTVR